ncbi:hypothetical protein [Segniliparus rotundus]|uniref:hypothetical protein n=1 Tax=Segniliparus rotundus TaxID=286802 RepID=UPI0002D66DFC|nr:hypothetical protein [Segniliparus rotundus]
MSPRQRHREQEIRDVQQRRRKAEAACAYAEMLEQEVCQITESARAQWLGDGFAKAVAGSFAESPGPKAQSSCVPASLDGCAL